MYELCEWFCGEDIQIQAHSYKHICTQNPSLQTTHTPGPDLVIDCAVKMLRFRVTTSWNNREGGTYCHLLPVGRATIHILNI